MTPECLGVDAILNLLDRPGDASPDDTRHLAGCRRCQWAVLVARRNRELIESPWPRSGMATVFRWRRVLAAAAVLVLAVGLGWWSWRPSELIGPIGGQMETLSATRGEEGAGRRYVLTVQLNQDAYVTYLYLGPSRNVKLPADASAAAPKCPRGLQQPAFWVDVTGDPPGAQWVAVVASKSPFDPLELREELRGATEPADESAPLEQFVGRIEQILGTHRELSFRGERFEVSAEGAFGSASP